MRRAVILCAVASLVALSLRAASPPSAAATGRWMRPVGQELGICQGGLAGWGWNYSGDDERTLVRIDVTGVRRSWRLPAPIRMLRFTKDCSNVWIVTEDWKHLYAVNANRDAQPVGLDQPLSREILAVYVSDDGQRAWVTLFARPQLMLATRSADSVHIAPVAGDTFELSDVTTANAGRDLWALPYERGLFVATDGGYRELRQMHDVDIAAVSILDDDTIGWAVPRDMDALGVFVVDSQSASVITRLLDKAVTTVETRGKFAWIQTLDDMLYVFRAERVAGVIHVEPLNGGRPLAINGTAIRLGNVYPVGDGTHAWLSPVAKHGAYQLWSTIWHAHTRADGNVEVSELDPRTHFGKPLRRIFLDHRDPEHLWIRSYDLKIYDTRVGATQPSQPVFPTSMQIDDLVPSSRPNRVWARTASFLTYVTGPAEDVKVRVALGGDELAFPQTKRPGLHGAPWRSVVKVSLQGPAAFMRQLSEEKVDLGAMIARDVRPTATVTLLLRQKRGNRTVTIAEGSDAPDQNGDVTMDMLGGARVDYSSPVEVKLTYHDDWNSDVHVVWSGVRVSATLWQRIQASPLFRAALFILLPITLLCIVFRQDVSLRSTTRRPRSTSRAASRSRRSSVTPTAAPTRPISVCRSGFTKRSKQRGSASHRDGAASWTTSFGCSNSAPRP